MSLILSSYQSAKQPQKTQKEEDEEILHEICTANGLTPHKLETQGPNVTIIEMFFSGLPRLWGLHNFPNLNTLVVIGQQINKVDGLDSLFKLKELWLCQCNIKYISGLEKLNNLVKLYLYQNEISKIENVDHLIHLEVLWLPQNKISHVEGISNLTVLKELNLAENRLEKIGHSLDQLVKLENLNLSGNDISSFREITQLVRLPSLRVLGLKDPQYSANPVCSLCNYSTHVLYHLPRLQRLDNYDVSGKPLRELAETTVVKKKMYYNMRSKTVRRMMSELIVKLENQREAALAFPRERMKALTFVLKSLEREMDEIQRQNSVEDFDVGSETESDKETKERELLEAARAKLHAIQTRIKEWHQRVRRVTAASAEETTMVRAAADATVHRLMVELETGGNVRFEDGSQDDVWFLSCHDLVLSRFCAADYRDLGVLGVKVHKITRIHNRMLRQRFDQRLADLVEDEEGPYGGSKSYKRLLEYLFYVWEPAHGDLQRELGRVIEEGFNDGDIYKQLGCAAAVPLTNSLSLADQARIRTTKASNSSSADHPTRTSSIFGGIYSGAPPRESFSNAFSSGGAETSCHFRHGSMIVAKVFLGRSEEAPADQLIRPTVFPGADSVYQPKLHQCPDSEAAASAKPLAAGCAEVGATTTIHQPRSCECSSRQCMWFAFDEQLVLPEFIVDFEYVTKLKAFDAAVASTSVGDKKLLEGEPSVDNDVINMPPLLKSRPRMVALTEELVIRMTKVESISDIVYLNLHGNGLARLKQLQSMTSLKKLVISFNELTRIDDLAHLSALEYLDASYNRIVSLEGLKGLSRLRCLDVDRNQLSQVREELSVLRKHAQSLTTLSLSDNPWNKPSGLRLRVISRLKSLTKLDGVLVTEGEATAAMRMAAGARVSQVSLLAHSRTDVVKPRSLSLLPTAQLLTMLSRNKPEKIGEACSDWFAKVTSLNLDNQHLSKLSNLERLENLRWASFNDNDITKIEGLDNCVNLEELHLENCCIARLENLQRLLKLRRLDLGHNLICTLDPGALDKLTSLTYLCLDNNKISGLNGLHRCVSLIELYLGNNLISNIREVFCLKSLNNLVILDLSGNPIASQTDNYRLFVIYHLKNIKALDGIAIESAEGGTAKDTFGGRLTMDFVAERYNNSNCSDLRELDFPNCSIRHVDLGNGQAFQNLRSVNLEHNMLTSLSGLIHLPNLRVLCLNHNRIEQVVAPSKSGPVHPHHVGGVTRPQHGGTRGHGLMSTAAATDLTESIVPLLEKLEVLHLGYNGITDLAALHLNRLVGLRSLFLQGNEIVRIEGLEGLIELKELVLDRNKVKYVSDNSFIDQYRLTELHMEENRLRDVANLHHLHSLQRLYLGMNRIQEVCDLEKLEALPNLIELSVISNPVSRRLLHRPMLVYRMPNLMVIDGIPVSEEERTKAELYFLEQQPTVTGPPGLDPGSLPGISHAHFKSNIGSAMHVRVTQMVTPNDHFRGGIVPTHWSSSNGNQSHQNKQGNQDEIYNDPRLSSKVAQQQSRLPQGLISDMISRIPKENGSSQLHQVVASMRSSSPQQDTTASSRHASIAQNNEPKNPNNTPRK